jgi:hypothetical protein
LVEISNSNVNVKGIEYIKTTQKEEDKYYLISRFIRVFIKMMEYWIIDRQLHE